MIDPDSDTISLPRPVIQKILQLTAEKYLRSIPEMIVKELALGMDSAFLGELLEGERVRTISFYAKDRFAGNREFALHGTPCFSVVGKVPCIHARDVRMLFPDDEILKELQAESFVGVPLFSSYGEPLGLIAALSRRPIREEHQERMKALLEIFAARAGPELERAKAEKLLKRSEENYRAVFNAANDAIFVHDIQTGAILAANEKMAEMYGYTPEEAIRLDIDALSAGTPGFTEQDALRRIRRAVEGSPQLFEWLAMRRNGELFWVEVNLKRAVISGEARLLAIVRDISARKRAEQKLQESEERFRQLAENTNQVFRFMTVDPEQILYVSPAFEAIWGYRSEELYRNPRLWMEAIHPEDRPLVEQSFASWAADRSPAFDREFRIVRSDGEIRWVRDRGTLVRDQQGRVARLSGIADDITDRKRFEAELEKISRQKDLILESAGDGIFGMDSSGNHVLVNRSALTMLGYSLEDLMGRHSHPIWHHTRPDGSAYPEEECRIYKTARDGVSRHVDDEVFWKKDGSCIPVEYITTPMHEGDRITGTVVTFHDITQRRQAEEALRLSESRFRNLFRQSSLSMQIFSPDGRTLDVNPALEQLWGVTADDLKDYNILEDKQLEEKGIMPYIRKGFAGEATEVPVVRYDPSEITGQGRVRWVKAFIYALKSGAGKVHEVVLMHLDVTETVKAEAALRESETRFRAFFELAAVGAVQIDPMTGRFLQVNDRFCTFIGYSREELLTRTFRDITHPDDRVLDEKFFEQVRTAAIAEYSTEKRYVHKKGHVIWAHVSATIIRDREGRPVSTAGIVQEITDRKLMEEEIRYMAQHDPLTGLPNRRLFSDILGQEVAQAERDGKKLALLFVDLDRFKEVNDRLGHEAGDQLLRETALRLRKLLRKADSIGRIGGDEFNIVLADITRAEDVADIAGKLVEGFRKPFQAAGRELRVTISVGIAFFPDDGRDIDSVLRAADMAMYHAKQRGRNQYEFYNAAINLASLERLKLETMLHRSLELREIVAFYQPLISVRTRRVVCAEALVRWNHPEKGLLLPGDFLPAVGADGFMTALDDWVLNTVGTQVKAWLDAGMTGPVCITVNLSARQFERPDLAAEIASILAATGAPPGCLTLEIPENTVMRRGERSAEQLKQLAGLGIHLSIDDFGTGCSSLNHLKRLPIESLKIDRSLVRDVATDWHSMSIMRAVTLMAHTMKLKVVAKGVETEAQFASLREAGCDEAQGYLLGRPMPADEFRELVGAGK